MIGYKIFEIGEHGRTVALNELFRTAEEAINWLENNGEYLVSYKVVGWIGNYRLELVEEDIKVKESNYYSREQSSKGANNER